MAQIELPWIEKYRPERLSDVVGQKEITGRLENYVKNRTMPNLLFAGQAGVGKTSSAVALAREMFGENFQQNFLELNASVTGDTPVLVRENGRISRTTFSEIAKKYFQGSEGYSFPEKLETLSIDKNYAIKFMPVSLISRHKVGKIARIVFEGGEVKTSLNHSVIVLDSHGNLAGKECKDVKKDDVLLSFNQEVETAKEQVIDFNEYPLKEANLLRSGMIPNPKITLKLGQISMDDDFAWLCGLYLAEGCASFNRKGSSGVTIFTLAYPKEKPVAERISEILARKFSLKTKYSLGKSGFDRKKESSIQVATFNTQFAKFFKENFYGGNVKRRATTKRVPGFMFNAPLEKRISFLKGYMGDAWGEWGKYVRYSSTSQENLIDIAWLAMTCGLNVALYNRELRIVWEGKNYKAIKANLMPSEPFTNAFEREGINYYYEFRHSLYHKKSKRILKSKIIEFIQNQPIAKRAKFSKLVQAAQSGLFGTKVKNVQISGYDDWVYDFSVPESQMFFGGTVPLLLHNSDDRGIDVVRDTIKNFARTLAFDRGFKIIFLDESDALTFDAQQALRRTMERYSRTCRFVLSANYSSKIIEPIQSRCVVFRFSQLSSKDIEARVKDVAKKEGVQVDDGAVKAVVYVCQGDLRKAINVLQAASSSGGAVSEKTVYEVSARARPEEVKLMIREALSGKFLEARALLEKLMYEYGMSGEDVVLQLHREMIDMDENEVPGKIKIELIDKIGEYNFRMVEGANERVQLEALLAQFLKYRK